MMGLWLIFLYLVLVVESLIIAILALVLVLIPIYYACLVLHFFFESHRLVIAKAYQKHIFAQFVGLLKIAVYLFLIYLALKIGIEDKAMLTALIYIIPLLLFYSFYSIYNLFYIHKRAMNRLVRAVFFIFFISISALEVNLLMEMGVMQHAFVFFEHSKEAFAATLDEIDEIKRNFN